MTKRDPVTGLTDAELARLADEAYAQRGDHEAWEVEDRPEVSADVRSVVSVRFNRGELEPIERAAAAAGVPLSTFIRNAAMNAVSPVDRAAVMTQLDALQASLDGLKAALGPREPAKRRRRAA
jgi:uncharacterized protein (DUF1778 family)